MTLAITPTTTALVAIDLQNGVVALPSTPHAATDVVAKVASIADALRAAGGLVVWVTVAPPIGPAALSPTLDNPPQMPDRFPGGWSDLVADLHVAAKDVTVFKRNWGAFHGTDLDLQLRRRWIDTIVLTGIATNLGVESTARDAYERGFDQIFVEDAMSGLGDGTHAMAVGSTFPRIGQVRSTDEVIAALADVRGR